MATDNQDIQTVKNRFGIIGNSPLLLNAIWKSIDKNSNVPTYFMKFKSVLLFAGFWFNLSGCSAQNDSDNSLLQIALYDFKQNDFTSCKNKLLHYVKKYPNDYKGWSFLGTVEMELENDSLANIALSKAVALNPKDFKALTGLGVLSKQNKDYQTAYEFYNKAISANPSYGKAYSSLSIIELRKGNYQKAVELGEKACSLDTKVLGMKSNLAIAYHFNKQFRERDSVMVELYEKGYLYIDTLESLFEGEIGIDDL
jgi:tetratricopeptide (TPR) repeat protein